MQSDRLLIPPIGAASTQGGLLHCIQLDGMKVRLTLGNVPYSVTKTLRKVTPGGDTFSGTNSSGSVFGTPSTGFLAISNAFSFSTHPPSTPREMPAIPALKNFLRPTLPVISLSILDSGKSCNYP